jgi:hypothetical protein
MQLRLVNDQVNDQVKETVERAHWNLPAIMP